MAKFKLGDSVRLDPMSRSGQQYRSAWKFDLVYTVVDLYSHFGTSISWRLMDSYGDYTSEYEVDLVLVPYYNSSVMKAIRGVIDVKALRDS